MPEKSISVFLFFFISPFLVVFALRLGGGTGGILVACLLTLIIDHYLTRKIRNFHIPFISFTRQWDTAELEELLSTFYENETPGANEETPGANEEIASFLPYTHGYQSPTEIESERNPPPWVSTTYEQYEQPQALYPEQLPPPQ